MRHIAAVLILAALAGCDRPPCPSEVHPELAPPGGTAVAICGALAVQGPDGTRWPRADSAVVAVGDSFTFGYGVEAGEAWPALIGARNLGVSGYTAEQVAEQAATASWLRDDALVWGVHRSDVVPGWERQAVRIALQHPYAYAVVLETPERESRWRRWRMERVLRRAGFEVIAARPPTDARWDVGDGVHMTAEGHAWYAERIREAIGRQAWR